MKHHILSLAWLALASFLAGCVGPKSAGVVDVWPAEISPGSIVRVQTATNVWPQSTPPRVLIGGRPALVVQTNSPTEADVLVPDLRARSARVQIVERGKRPGAASERIEVLPSQNRRLLLSFSANSIRLVSSRPAADTARPTLEDDQRRLAYDVLNKNGSVLSSGIILHPTLGRTELFDEPQPGQRVIRRLPPDSTALFSAVIPETGAPVAVRFYDLPSGPDPATPAGRAARQFIQEIKINR